MSNLTNIFRKIKHLFSCMMPKRQQHEAKHYYIHYNCVLFTLRYRPNEQIVLVAFTL